MKVLLFIVASIVVIQAFKAESKTDKVQEGSGRSDLLDIVQDVVTVILQQAMELLNTLRSTLTNIVTAALRLLTELISDVEKLLLTIADKVLQQIQQVADIHLPCVVNQEKNVQQVLATAREDIAICTNTAFDAIIDVGNRTATFELEIANEIRTIKQLLSKCFSINPIEILKCVIGQVGEIRDSLSRIALTAKEAFGLAATEVDQILQDTRSCVAHVIEGVRNQLDAISQDIVNCIETQKPI